MFWRIEQVAKYFLGAIPSLSMPNLPLILLPDLVAFGRQSPSPPRPQLHPFRFEPLVLSCRASDSSFNIASANIVTGANNLRLLLDFVFGQADKSFRIDMEVRRGTTFMARWESDVSNLTETSRCRGYGRGFEVASTSSQMDLPQTSHHRILSYNLAELKIIVQYQADACDCSCDKAWAGRGTSASTRPVTELPITSSERLHLVAGGVSHDLSCLVEIKSREQRNHHVHDILPQMWLSQQSTMLMGRHSRGCFTSVDICNMAGEIREWEAQNATKLGQFAALLTKIHMLVSAAAEDNRSRCFSLLHYRDDDSESLRLFEREGGQAMLAPEE